MIFTPHRPYHRAPKGPSLKHQIRHPNDLLPHRPDSRSKRFLPLRIRFVTPIITSFIDPVRGQNSPAAIRSEAGVIPSRTYQICGVNDHLPHQPYPRPQ
ncbi:hypothetical protein DPMN_090990 [Dreissena polymorpha]|uniref:Uncharacterized protein n=1 Tax=Dreissena polymorpha TaxID=45954 RepID=A0A9D4QYQ6_DREPO|nr:hypothetical protein DPMN_090990 [Dreissena polymorpha]